MKCRLVYTNKIYEIEVEKYTKVLDFRLYAEKKIGLAENSTVLFNTGPLEEILNLDQACVHSDTTILVFSKHRPNFELRDIHRAGSNSSSPNAKAPITKGNYAIFNEYEKKYKCSYSESNTASNLYIECKSCKYKSSSECKYCGCDICSGKNIQNLICCIKCSKNYHTQCLPTYSNQITKKDWICYFCDSDNEISVDIVKTQLMPNFGVCDSDLEYFHGARGLKNSISNDSIILEPKSTLISNNIASENLYQTPSNKNIFTKDSQGFNPPKKARSRNKFYIGKIPGVPVGTSWDYRVEVAKAGVHRPHVAGISGNKSEGSESIVLAGGYIDDEDYGEEFIYTGSGGDTAPMSDSNKKEHQELTRSNYALALNCDVPVNVIDGAEAQDWKKSQPIRVVRSFKLKKHNPGFAPLSGNRYDGLYKLVSYHPERSKHNNGSFVWRFRFRRDDTEPAPWTREGIERSKTLGIKPNAQLNESSQSSNIVTSININSSCKNTQSPNQCKIADIDENSNIFSKNVAINSDLHFQKNPYNKSQSTVSRQMRLNKNQISRNWSESHDKFFGNSASFSPNSSISHTPSGSYNLSQVATGFIKHDVSVDK